VETRSSIAFVVSRPRLNLRINQPSPALFQRKKDPGSVDGPLRQQNFRAELH
jgi:hypothetical protein